MMDSNVYLVHVNHSLKDAEIIVFVVLRKKCIVVITEFLVQSNHEIAMQVDIKICFTLNIILE